MELPFSCVPLFGWTVSFRTGFLLEKKEAGSPRNLKEVVMVMDYFAVDVVREDAVCPLCGSDLILRTENGLILVLCVDCEFSQY